jgi:hypothetical protein
MDCCLQAKSLERILELHLDLLEIPLVNVDGRLPIAEFDTSSSANLIEGELRL